MGSWLTKLSVSQAAGEAAEAVSRPALTASRSRLRPVAIQRPSPQLELLEGRVFLSAAPLDLTNNYAGFVTYKNASKVRVKEAVTVTFDSQNSTGFVTGQVQSAHFGNVGVAGQIDGKKLKLIGTDAGRLIESNIAKRGKALSGTMFSGVDDSQGKFKVKVVGDAANSTITAGGAMSMARARALMPSADGTGTGGLDPTIDPATGLPIDPTTGLPIDPSQTPGDGGGDPTIPPGGNGNGAPAPAPGGNGNGAPIPQGAPGTLIGNNYDFTGLWLAEFNNNGTGSIDDPNTPGATTIINGTRPGTDQRVVTFTVVSQDIAGLVMGTVDVEEFGTFSFTGFVNVAHIDLALTGTSTGAVTGTMSLDFDAATAFTTFDGQLIDTLSNTYIANGPINNGISQGAIPPPPVPLPTGVELYHVDLTDTNGLPTVGNFDPGGASIGMDFAVGGTPLSINSLGAFDDNADGLNNTIRVAIYNIATPGAPVVVADLDSSNSALAPNSSFRYLTTFTPVVLTTGVYRIVAFGYGGAENAGDIGVDNYQGPVPVADTAGGNIQYPVSNSLNANNYLSNPTGTNIVFPTFEQGLPLNRYLAGSLLYEFTTVPPSPPPGPPVVPPPPLVKPPNSAFPGGVFTGPNGQDVFGSQSGGIIPP